MSAIGKSHRGSIEQRVELWRQRFREFSSRSCTVEQFCKQLGVTVATFYYWRKKLAEIDTASQEVDNHHKTKPHGTRGTLEAHALAGNFVPVRITRANTNDGLVIVRLPSGAEVHIPTNASDVIATVVTQVSNLGDASAIEVM